MADALVFEVKRGDTAPAFRARCLNGDTPLDLTGASVRFLMRSYRGTEVLVAGPMTLDDQTTDPGWVRRPWAAGDLATAGTYRAEVEVTWGDGTRQTFPRNGYVNVVVTGDVG